jgi:hypothetical protein
MHRRDFLRTGLVSGGVLALGPLAGTLIGRDRTIGLMADPADPIAHAAPVTWALGQLEGRLTSAGFTVRRLAAGASAPVDLCVVACGGTSAAARAALGRAGATLPDGPERLALLSTTVGRSTPAIMAAGSDARGLVYALLEIADRVGRSASAEAFMRIERPLVEAPANGVRSVMRQFTSETLDTPWLFDRAFWPEYLSMLAAARFNRLHLAFGLGYDTLNGVTDSYLVFLYPFLVNVPGYSVTVSNFTPAQREAHLAMLRYISEETVARGLDFQLGIWMHGYRMPNSPRAKYVVEGLTPEEHAAYSRDALAEVLRACPAISSVGLRIHGESGVAEGSYAFWKTVFDGVPKSGRTVEIDLHAKGIDAQMIDQALATGMPVNLSPKYWAEHLGMPYHQAAIRDLEMPVEGKVGRGLMTLSEGQRVFTRYGYADLLRDDRKYTVRHRIFSGTQRLLLSGDPDATRAYARMFQFCGSTGFDLMEPLTCRGRRGTGIEGTRRSGYVDAALEPADDWQKYAYLYRVWGRLTYDPETDAEVTRRGFVGDTTAQTALARVSRILPIVTTAYLPSAACDAYWPEVYWNQPMAEPPRPNPYGDSPQPRTFQNASPLDPQLFLRMTDCADELLKGERSGKYSPVEVAGWLDELSAAAPSAGRPVYSILSTDVASGRASVAALQRQDVDIDILRGLGRFFAQTFGAGVLYAIPAKTNDRRALDEAITAYGAARTAWAQLSARAAGVYAADLSASDKISNRGAWADRLPAIDEDIARLTGRRPAAVASSDPAVSRAVDAVLAPPRRTVVPVTHARPASFRPGAPLALEFVVGGGQAVASARLFYRHVNQAERYESAAMTLQGSRLTAAIPGAYTDSPFQLQYYVELRRTPADAWLYPGFAPDRLNLPYFVVTR